MGKLDKIKIPTFFLESGKDLFVTETIHCKHPTLQEIIDIDKESNGFRSQELYDSYISIFLTDPYDSMVYLDDMGIDYESSNPFEVFCIKFSSYMEKFLMLCESLPEGSEEREAYEDTNLYFRAFDFFFGIPRFYAYKDETEGKWYLLDVGGNVLMNDEIYQYVYKFIREINGIVETPDKIMPENEDYKRILIEDKRDEIKRKEARKKANEDEVDDDDEDDDRIGARLSALLWVSNGVINPLEKFQLHIYDLISGTNRFDKFLNYENTMVSAYTGHTNMKKINLDKLHWAR